MRNFVAAVFAALLLCAPVSVAIAGGLGDGTKSSPFIIGTLDDLRALAVEVNVGNSKEGVYFQLQNDVDLGGSATNQWLVIGTQSKPFMGHFDGCGFTIRGLYIDNDRRFQGFFGCLGKGGSVSNLTVEGTVNATSHSGGIVGGNLGTLINCTNQASVSGVGYMGGVAGYNLGLVEKCVNNGAVSGKEYLGGIAGGNARSIKHSQNNGTVSSDGVGAGGVVGANEKGTVLGCTNSGTVGGNAQSSGGIAGGSSGKVIGCKNLASIGGSERIGGVIGVNNSGFMTNCSNSGKVTGTGFMVGGVVGYNYKGAMSISCNSGEVSGHERVGGMTGYNNDGSIFNCYNTGKVTGTGNAVGGVAGINGGPLRSCYNAGRVTGPEITGSVVAANVESSLEDSGVHDCYGLKGSVAKGTEYKYSTEMSRGKLRSAKFVEDLNAKLSTPMWAIDKSQNCGFPVFIWQK